jgi:hypothetical protein
MPEMAQVVDSTHERFGSPRLNLVIRLGVLVVNEPRTSPARSITVTPLWGVPAARPYLTVRELVLLIVHVSHNTVAVLV